MKPFALALTIALAAISTLASAHEGMWMPRQLPEIANELKATGLELDPAALSKLTEFPMGAIVSLGGCSASFVSGQGLVVTNHHCAYGSIQYNSTAKKNLLSDGFLAKTPAEELPAAPGSRVYVTVNVENVTTRIIDPNTAKLTGKKRIDAMEANEKSLVAACEKQPGHRCNVASFYGGLEYHLIKQMEIRDVRLVYAPPEGVGKFGGDTDNWMWPRHTGDFSFYRAYVGKDGKPADFSPDNVPYKPAHYLKLARQALKEGDFVMVTGYPGRTNRHRLPSEVEFTFGWSYPISVRIAREELDIIARKTQGRPDAALAYRSTVASINNRYKKTEGLLEAYSKTDLLARKKSEYTALKAWLTKHPSPDLAAIESLIAERNQIAKSEFLLDYITPRFLDAARTLYELAIEKAKPNDLERKPDYQERNWPRIRQSLEAIDKRYDEQVDKALALHFLNQYLNLPVGQQNGDFLAALGMKPGMAETDVKRQLDTLYRDSTLRDQKTRLAWIDRPITDYKASNDTFIKAAVALYPDDIKRENRDKELSGRLQRAYASYMNALIAYKSSKGEAVYPDANSTLRVSFGEVAGRPTGTRRPLPSTQLSDGLTENGWAPFTTLRGIAAKHTGKGEFNAPAAQINAIKAKTYGPYRNDTLDSVPVNFLATLDITGGNSGSPVLNARAELVGLAFDGTLDSVISDWDFNPAMTRTIAVDSRYMLWQMQIVDHADNLLHEMNIP